MEEVIAQVRDRGFEVVIKSDYEGDKWFVEFVNSERSVFALHTSLPEAVRIAAVKALFE